MASEVSICNLALQRLGANRISSLSEDSKGARECNASYESIRDRELRKHVWSFAKKRTTLAPNATAPEFDFDYQFDLPSDCLRVVKVTLADGDDDEAEDWTIEGRKILANGSDALRLVYVARITDPNTFDQLFIDTLYHAIAMQLCEPLTQSNTKLDRITSDYTEVIAQAKQVNSIETPSKNAPEDPWVTVRQ